MRLLMWIPLVAGGCGDASLLRSGTYVLESWTLPGGDGSEVVPEGVLELDLEAGLAAVQIAGAERVEVSLLPLQRADWIEGCPTNFTVSRTEVAELDVDLIDADGHPMADPFVVAECRDGEGVFLGDGQLDHGQLSEPCGRDYTACLYFR